MGEKKTDEPLSKKETKESPFVADETLEMTPSVPYLNKSSKFDRSGQLETEHNRRLNHSSYKSRRPFKPTETPSLWQQQKNASLKADNVNFQQIKEALYVSDDELILIDTNPPKITTAATKETKKTFKNRALNRSLKGIMEQEKLQNPGKNKSLWTTKSGPFR